VEAICKEFISNFTKVNVEANIASASKKLSQILISNFKNDKEALLRFDLSGKNSCYLDVFA
jgi:hypothetical protein